MKLVIGLIIALAALIPLSIINAQTCTPQQEIRVTTAPSGLVTVSSQGYIITHVQVRTDANNNARIIPPTGGAPVSLPLDIAPNNTVTNFSLRAMNPSLAVTVPMTVYTECGPWETFAGGGPGVMPISEATATLIPTATPIPPTATNTPIRTNTPLPTSTPYPLSIQVNENSVLQGNKITVSWLGRVAPTTTDFIALVNSSTNAVTGPAIYTSSCTSTPGSITKTQGACTFTVAASIPQATYFVRLFAGNISNVLATAPTVLNVLTSGGVSHERGHLWGTIWMADIPDVLLTGGFVGFQAFVNAGDPGSVSGTSFHHVGVADFGLIGDSFVEAGAVKFCYAGVPSYCQSYPYMSWMDSQEIRHQATWNGTNGYPLAPLNINTGITFQFKVFALGIVRWTGEFCDLTGYCCPLWLTAPACRPRGPDDQPPITAKTRFPWAFAGTETLNVWTASGLTSVASPAYCCHIATSQWSALECWHWAFDSYDKSVVYTDITNCVPYSGWYTMVGYR